MRILTPCFPCFRLHPKLEGAFGVFTFRDFFPMLDLIFSHKSNGLPGAQQKMLLSLYPKLKASPHIDNIQTVAIGSRTASILHVQIKTREV